MDKSGEIDEASGPGTREAIGAWEGLFQAFAKELARGKTGDLPGWVRELSETYTRDRESLGSLQGRPELLAARLAFFVPRDLLKIALPLAELDRVGWLPRGRVLRVLDMGCGPGTMTFGLARYLASRGGVEELEVLGIDEDSTTLGIFRRIAEEVERLGWPRIRLQTRRAHARSRQRGVSELSGLDRSEAPFDLILFGFVLNEARVGEGEARARADLLRRAARLMNDDGAMIVLEPALKLTAQALQAVRDDLLASTKPPRLHVFAPCAHELPCPMLGRPRDWCHVEMDEALPPLAAEIAREAGLRDARLTFSYLTLRHREGSRVAQASTSSSAERSTASLRVVSQPLRSKGKCELVLCGEGRLVRAMRQDRDRSELNASFEEATRGSILELDGVDARGERLRVEKDTRATLHLATESTTADDR